MKPILIGLDNPHSRDPAMALWPLPAGCSGWRLWKMLSERTGCSRRQYADAFDRRNLSDLAGPLPEGSTAVLLGEEVRRSFKMPTLSSAATLPSVRGNHVGRPRLGLVLLVRGTAVQSWHASDQHIPPAPFQVLAKRDNVMTPTRKPARQSPTGIAMSKPIEIVLLFRGYWLRHFDKKWHVYAAADTPRDKWLARCDCEQSARNFVLIRRQQQRAQVPLHGGRDAD